MNKLDLWPLSTLPLKQGLKRISLVPRPLAMPLPLSTLPLKQGLKPQFTVGILQAALASLNTSIKTRIETSGIYNCFCVCCLLSQHFH